MTPLGIETLLTVYHSPYEKLNSFGIAHCAGLIQLDNRCTASGEEERHGYVLTDCGRAMVEALTTLPLPEKHEVWTIEFEYVWTKET